MCSLLEDCCSEVAITCVAYLRIVVLRTCVKRLS